MSSLPDTSRAVSSRRSQTAVTAASMPFFSSSGCAPAATLRRPSCTIAWASTVAVVVPSPATSLVLVATSLASWAPRFSYGLLSSISRAMVTPSFVIVGAPNFLSITTLRPLGPSVTLTALARASTPRWRLRRAFSSNSRILAILAGFPFVGGAERDRPGSPVVLGRPGRCRATVEQGGAGDQLSRTASTSREDRMRYSSPLYFTSVPPYTEVKYNGEEYLI